MIKMAKIVLLKQLLHQKLIAVLGNELIFLICPVSGFYFISYLLTIIAFQGLVVLQVFLLFVPA